MATVSQPFPLTRRKVPPLADKAKHVPADVQKLLAAADLRDEYVFPVPAVIEAQPTLVGYYRLLLGAPQKTFYKGSTGFVTG